MEYLAGRKGTLVILGGKPLCRPIMGYLKASSILVCASNMIKHILLAATALAAFVLLATGCNINNRPHANQPPAEWPPPTNNAPFGEPPFPGAGAYNVWNYVWCPDSQDSAKNFRPVASLDDLPVHPLGDGVNNCYMAAFDTSRFSTDDQQVRGCDNLDSDAFGENYTCTEVRTANDFASVLGEKAVAIVMNDITGIERLLLSTSKRKALVIMGLYDPGTKRPVLLEGKVKLAWQSVIKGSEFTVMNLRIKSETGCFATTTNRFGRMTLAFQSVTAKCAGRFIMQSPETLRENARSLDVLKREYYERTGKELVDEDGDGLHIDDADLAAAWPIDDRSYFRNILVMGGQSHTMYLDHNFLNWIQDSIIMTPMNKGKHAVKLIGRYNVVHNSILTNAGIHNEPLVNDDPLFGNFNQHPKEAGMAELSMISCGRNVIDRVTLFHRFIDWSPGGGHANLSAMLWQKRPEIGEGCDIPFSYAPFAYNNPYYGPAHFPDFYTGRRYERSPYWDDAFWSHVDADSDWNNPYMLTSFVTGVDLRFLNAHNEDYKKDLYDNAVRPASVTLTGSYPIGCDYESGSCFNSGNFEFSDAPAAWKERLRIVFNNNVFDDGIKNPTQCGPIGPTPNAHPRLDRDLFDELAAMPKCFFVGENTRATVGEVDQAVKVARDAFLGSLPPPPWTRWPGEN